MNRIGAHLLRQYGIRSDYQIMKTLSSQMKDQYKQSYETSLSIQDSVRSRDDFRVMKSIRRKLKEEKLIIRVTDKSNTMYICHSNDFEKKVQAYREKTNAYQQLSSNPLEEIFFKVTRLLNDLRTQKLIQARHHTDMMPKRDKIRLGYMYFNPKAHKVCKKIMISDSLCSSILFIYRKGYLFDLSYHQFERQQRPFHISWISYFDQYSISTLKKHVSSMD